MHLKLKIILLVLLMSFKVIIGMESGLHYSSPPSIIGSIAAIHLPQRSHHFSSLKGYNAEEDYKFSLNCFPKELNRSKNKKETFKILTDEKGKRSLFSTISGSISLLWRYFWDRNGWVSKKQGTILQNAARELEGKLQQGQGKANDKVISIKQRVSIYKKLILEGQERLNETMNKAELDLRNSLDHEVTNFELEIKKINEQLENLFNQSGQQHKTFNKAIKKVQKLLSNNDKELVATKMSLEQLKNMWLAKINNIVSVLTERLQELQEQQARENQEKLKNLGDTAEQLKQRNQELGDQLIQQQKQCVQQSELIDQLSSALEQSVRQAKYLEETIKNLAKQMGDLQKSTELDNTLIKLLKTSKQHPISPSHIGVLIAATHLLPDK